MLATKSKQNLKAYRVDILADKTRITTSNGTGIVSNDLGDLLNYFWQQYEETDLCVFWDLDSSIAPILKLLGKDKCQQLLDTAKCFYRPFSLFYIPSKVFSITRGKPRTSYYGLSTFYPDIADPCDCNKIEEYGKQLLDAFNELGLDVTKLTSPIAIYEQCVLKHLDMPGISRVPIEAAKLAYLCSGRLWTEAGRIGYFQSVYDYDLISSFPSIIADLYDLDTCVWLESKEYQPSALYGYCTGKVTINNNIKVSPIIKEDYKGELISPVGSWNTILTKGEIDFINRWSIGTFEIANGWWCVPKYNFTPGKPFRQIIERLLAHKGDGLVGELAKRISVSFYGKFGETHKDELGWMFNPVYFAEISTQIRLKVADFIYSNKLENNIIHISVDGFLADRLVEVPVGWKVKEVSEAIVVSSGLVFYNDRKPMGITIDKLLEMIKADPNKSYYEVKLPRRITLAEALERDFEDLGEVRDTYSSIDLVTISRDRYFAKTPHTGGELLEKQYSSEPIKL